MTVSTIPGADPDPAPATAAGVADLRTDVGNARRLVARHGHNIRYVAEWDHWLTWDAIKERWEPDRDGAVVRLAEETTFDMLSQALGLNSQTDRDQLLKHAMRSQAEPRLKAMINLAKAEDGITISAERLDANPWLLGVQNGVIELDTGLFRPARRADLITKCAGVSYDPNADCPSWKQFLGTVTANDSDLQAYLQRVVGYVLTGSVRDEVMFVLHGLGRNGKSTFRETIHDLAGTYALAADAMLMVERKTPGSATEEIARLKGERFVAVNETAENDQLNESRVKFITSQDMITARNLYGHFFDFFPTHKLFLATNHKPIVRGTDEGIWRRLHLVPFAVSIDPSAVETNFREKRLLPELPGILNWALLGLADYLKDGLRPPGAVVASTDEYLSDMDVVGQWLKERCITDASASISVAEAYGDYTSWAHEELGWALSKIKFRRHLADRGFAGAKGTGGTRMIKGLRFSPRGPIVLAVEDGKAIYDDRVIDLAQQEGAPAGLAS
jgi:putative DNA primase/helicase